MDKVKKKVLKNANAHVLNNIKLREGMHSRWNKCCVVAEVNTGRIEKVKATKRGAQSELKRKKSEIYYSQHNQEMVSYGAGLDIVEVKDSELLEINDTQLWYNTMWYEYQNFHSDITGQFNYCIEKYNLGSEIVELIEEYSQEIRKGSFTQDEELHKNLIALR